MRKLLLLLAAVLLPGCTILDFDPETRHFESRTFGKARVEVNYDATDGSLTAKTEGDGVSEGFVNIVKDTVGAAASVFGGSREPGDTIVNVNNGPPDGPGEQDPGEPAE